MWISLSELSVRLQKRNPCAYADLLQNGAGLRVSLFIHSVHDDLVKPYTCDCKRIDALNIVNDDSAVGRWVRCAYLVKVCPPSVSPCVLGSCRIQHVSVVASLLLHSYPSKLISDTGGGHRTSVSGDLNRSLGSVRPERCRDQLRHAEGLGPA